MKKSKSNIIAAYCPVCNSAITEEDIKNHCAVAIPTGYACSICDTSTGVMIKEKCAMPGCGKPLMANLKGNTWCTGDECNFHRRLD